MFERFTKEARFTVVQAQDECRALSGERIGTEHLLLALLDVDGPAAGVLHDHGVESTALRAAVQRRAGDTLDAEALRSLGIDLDAVREAAEETFGPGALDAPPGRHKAKHIPFAPETKKALELSLRQALRLKHNHIGDGHVLLGLLHDENTEAVKLLKSQDINIDTLRSDITRVITMKAA